MRVDLGKDPSGEERWAELVDPDEMTQGARFRVQELLSLFNDESEHGFVASLKLRAKLIAEVVAEWSFDLPLPNGDPDKAMAVPGIAYEKLVEATEEHESRLDFIRAGKTSSESRTGSKATNSPAKSRTTKH